MTVVGIDLGTTYSAVARLDEMKKPDVLSNFEGTLFTPSVVYFENNQKVVVGEHAKNSSEIYPENVVEFVKNHMGSDRTWNFFGESYSPSKISAIILQKLKQDAEEAMGKPVTGAVITVPAIFGEAQRNATREAAAIAGLEVISLLDEPVAAALNYGLAKSTNQSPQNILVYDLGGGTFDLTIIRLSLDKLTMLHTKGDRMLGGKLWDDKIIEYVATCFKEKHDDDPLDNLDTRQYLRLIAEKAKKQLTAKEKAAITCHYGGKMERVEITREIFEELTADLLERTETITALAIKALVEKGDITGWGDIDQVLLVGGASKMPQVSRMVQNLSGKKPRLADPDLAVAKGAALFSEMEIAKGFEETGDSSKLQEHGIGPDELALLPQKDVVPVCSFALGQKLRVVTSGNGSSGNGNEEVGRDGPQYVNQVLIHKNSQLPAHGKDVCFTIYPNQSSVKITVLEGDDPDPDRCFVIGEGAIVNIPDGLPAESPVEVEFTLTKESLIQVTAKELTYGTVCQFELKREQGQSEEALMKQVVELAQKQIE